MRSLNRCTFIGSLANNPSAGAMRDGTATTRFILIVPEQDTRATLVSITALGKVAETCNRMLREGVEVYAEGRWHTLREQHADGTVFMSAELALENFQILNGRNLNK